MAAQLHYASLITRQDPNARVYLRVGHASAGEAGYGPAGPPQDLHVNGMIGTALGRAAEFPQAAAMLKSGHRDREEQPDLFRTRQVLIAKQLELGPEHVPGQRTPTGYIFLIASRRIDNRTQVHVGGNYVHAALLAVRQTNGEGGLLVTNPPELCFRLSRPHSLWSGATLNKKH